MVHVFLKVLLHPKWEQFLSDRKLENQYQRAKKNLLAGRFVQIDFKKRKPKPGNNFYFRINKQFRVIGHIESGIFYVDKIDNHQ